MGSRFRGDLAHPSDQEETMSDEKYPARPTKPGENVIGRDGTDVLLSKHSGQVRHLWLIMVGSWGNAFFWGTEEEAEEWRAHKARWARTPDVKKNLDKMNRLIDEMTKLEKLLYEAMKKRR